MTATTQTLPPQPSTQDLPLQSTVGPTGQNSQTVQGQLQNALAADAVPEPEPDNASVETVPTVPDVTELQPKKQKVVKKTKSLARCQSGRNGLVVLTNVE